ncbi:6773_t:CDS:2 [Funneliformis geosporum]|uniref:6773_t:CDS:1 n=1 Tax=Funneliformis geosporum TaxID=1117311 RepID=A0A9W4SZI9_9GLOM|nr:6773_t:CDS:2 [Funneliformis geosporum]
MASYLDVVLVWLLQDAMEYSIDAELIALLKVKFKCSCHNFILSKNISSLIRNDVLTFRDLKFALEFALC